MIGTRKKFDLAEHNIYDVKGKDAVITYLNSVFKNETLYSIENSNRYGIDILTLLKETDEVIAAWEVEVRYGNWAGEINFPYNTINCIERKDYLWQKTDRLYNGIPYKTAKDIAVFYVQLNKECTRAVVLNSKHILKYPLVAWTNRKAVGEYVRQVPASLADHINLC